MRALKEWLILWVPAGLQPVRGFDLMRYLGTWHEIARQPSLLPATLQSLIDTTRQAGSNPRALIYRKAAAGPSAGNEYAFPVGKPVPVLSILGGIHHDQRHP